VTRNSRGDPSRNARTTATAPISNSVKMNGRSFQHHILAGSSPKILYFQPLDAMSNSKNGIQPNA